MTDLEISQALALAIGYLPEHVRAYGVGSVNYNNGEGVIQVFRHDGVYGVHRTECNHLWNNFRYTNWAVIGPIAERFDCFPWVLTEQLWETPVRAGSNVVRFCQANTPQKAIALAVIGSKK